MNGAPSHLRALMRFVWSGLRAKGAAKGYSEIPKRRLAAEWNGSLTDTRIAAYLAVTDGDGIACGSEDGDPLPPIYPALWETALFLNLLADATYPLPRGGLLHLGGERLQLRPLRTGDRVRCRIELDRAEPASGGVQLTLVSRTWNEVGQLCCQSDAILLLRWQTADKRPRERSEERAGSGERDAPPSSSRELAEWAIRSNHGRRYARVSGDYNPVHLWPWTARPFGFRQPILHGFCTEALAAHALIRSLWNGDPTALRRLRIRFRAPVFLPSRVQLLMAEEERGRGRFWVARVGPKQKICAEGEFAGG
jgi:acyl dehydratase